MVCALLALFLVGAHASLLRHSTALRHRAQDGQLRDPNKRYFIISQWADTASCTTEQLWNMTEEAGVCVDLGVHSSGWSCPPISRNSGLRWIKYQSYNSVPSATNAKDTCTVANLNATHWNFCGECKQNVLRQCADDGTVKIFNCSDQECKHCPSAPVVMKEGSCVDSTPLPQVAGQAVQLVSIGPNADSMYHQWYEGSGTCQSNASLPHGWDLIALGECNNGWKFECL